MPTKAKGQKRWKPEYGVKLIPIDLMKHSGRNEGDDDPPDRTFIAGRTYLILEANRFHTATADRTWFGWSFYVGYHLQYDKPGTNHSRWQGAWELKKIKS